MKLDIPNIKEVDGNIIFKLNNYGYLLITPIERTNDNQHYSLTLKVNDVMAISGRSMCVVSDVSELFKGSLLFALEDLKKIIRNIHEIVKGERE